MERLTKYITPVGVCMTSLNSMKHYMPCVTCRKNAVHKVDANGKEYTEKFSFCDTCEVKMLFHRLKYYEDLEEQRRLYVYPVEVGDYVYYIEGGYYKKKEFCKVSRPIRVVEISHKLQRKSGTVMHGFITENGTRYSFNGLGKTVFLTREEAEAALNGGTTE